MKITSVDARRIDAIFRNLIITRIRTDEGITGCSEVVTKRFDAALKGIFSARAREVHGDRVELWAEPATPASAALRPAVWSMGSGDWST